MYTMNSKQLIKEMKQAGWKEIRGKGNLTSILILTIG